MRKVVVVGGGIVGLATAWRLLARHPHTAVTLLEKEAVIGRHQSGHNSGVLHSGVYYRPGSLKASNCRRGKAMMEAFCHEQGVPFETCGKVIVALDEAERERLERIHERGLANGVRCDMIGPERLRELEPHAAGIAALHVPEAGIVDFTAVCERLRAVIEHAGGQVVTEAKVTRIAPRDRGIVARSSAGEFEADMAINCAGLHCDRVARASSIRPPVRIVPFRGEYYELKPAARCLCRNLIYPVPDPGFPFLGVHFTRMIRGGVECGPNAVLAFAREGYTKWRVNATDLLETLASPAFWRLARRHWRTGLGEVHRSWSKAAFVRALQRLMPEITGDDLQPAGAGVRAQAIARDGTLVDDFAIVSSGRMVHVLNAPSPGATSALAIGDRIVDMIERRLDLSSAAGSSRVHAPLTRMGGPPDQAPPEQPA